ncbi:DNA-binding domain-containing protein [Paracidovorax sp. MALMAid1276]|uniref:HvfC/BufC N-terminal domain-containing protein n=1 Tax=Paracidovorax sp. MALMAid1276 TaxID=3411631 RepID=UPI003B9C3DE0
MQLSTFQDGFSGALQGQAPAAPWLMALQAQPGFAVYRNTVLKACVDALQASYPTVSQLVGDDWFRAAAAVYARAQPPGDGRLMDYGAGFADFLAGFAPAAGLPYLGGVAALDRCWTECHLAADAPAADRAWWARQPPQALAALRLHPHPAARWAWCADHPAYALWQHHRDGLPVPDGLEWKGDGGLLTRPEAAVGWRSLPRAGCALLDACAAGMPLEAAATAALTAEPGIDLGLLLGDLLDAGALTHRGLVAQTGPAPPLPQTGEA